MNKRTDNHARCEFRLSEVARGLIDRIAAQLATKGIKPSRTAVVEMAIRQLAKKEKLD